MTHRYLQDELNCPACPAEPLMEACPCTSHRLASGWNVTCPDCGFSISAASAQQLREALSILQFQHELLQATS